jgi:hypothetical protein
MIVDGGIISNLQYVLGPALAGEETSKKDLMKARKKRLTRK